MGFLKTFLKKTFYYRNFEAHKSRADSVIMRIPVSITQHLGAYDMSYLISYMCLHFPQFLGKITSLLSFFQDLNDLFGLNLLSHFRNGNKPIYSFWRHTMVVVYRLF